MRHLQTQKVCSSRRQPYTIHRFWISDCDIGPAATERDRPVLTAPMQSWNAFTERRRAFQKSEMSHVPSFVAKCHSCLFFFFSQVERVAKDIRVATSSDPITVLYPRTKRSRSSNACRNQPPRIRPLRHANIVCTAATRPSPTDLMPWNSVWQLSSNKSSLLHPQ